MTKQGTGQSSGNETVDRGKKATAAATITPRGRIAPSGSSRRKNCEADLAREFACMTRRFAERENAAAAAAAAEAEVEVPALPGFACSVVAWPKPSPLGASVRYPLRCTPYGAVFGAGGGNSPLLYGRIIDFFSERRLSTPYCRRETTIIMSNITVRLFFFVCLGHGFVHRVAFSVQ